MKMSRGALYSVMGMYNRDQTIFDNMLIPAQIDRDSLTNKLLIDCAELEILYPDCDMLKESLGYWSKAHLHSWEMMFISLNKEDYDPFTDFDRHEEYTEHYSDLNNLQANGRGSQRAFNDADLTDITGSTSSSVNDRSGSRDHTLRQYGNSALGTNQDIIKKEIELRIAYNVIDLIITQFKRDFCLLVY